MCEYRGLMIAVQIDLPDPSLLPWLELEQPGLVWQRLAIDEPRRPDGKMLARLLQFTGQRAAFH